MTNIRPPPGGLFVDIASDSGILDLPREKDGAGLGGPIRLGVCHRSRRPLEAAFFVGQA